MEKKTKKKKKKTEKESPVTFRAHWQRYTKPKLYTDLLIYLYSGLLGEKRADKDLAEHIKQLEKLDFDISKEPVYLKKGTSVLIRPEMPGFRFNPRESIVEWYKDFVPVAFRMVPLLKGPFPERGEKIYGQVNFFVGPLLIAEININVIIKERLSGGEEFTANIEASAPYQKIFASYAREDSEIVERIEQVYEAIGDKYMRDLVKLRSGEEWEPALLELIKQADVFHLFWSKAAKKSPYVEMEWREALKQKKKNFIRVVCLEEPMPQPIPAELKKIHFATLTEMHDQPEDQKEPETKSEEVSPVMFRAHWQR